MANGKDRIYNDLSDPRQTPDADLFRAVDSLVLPIADLSPTPRLQRIWLRQFLTFLTAELPFSQELQDAVALQGRLYSQTNAKVNEAVAERQQLSNRQTDQEERIQSNSQTLGELAQRIAALEHGGGASTPVAVRGTLTYGILGVDRTTRVDSDGAVFAGTPATVNITFPAVIAENQRWFLEYPQGVEIQHIWNEALQRVDEKGAWSADLTARTYTSPPQSVGFTGSYSIAVVTA